MDEKEFQTIEGFLRTIKEVCTSPMSCNRVKRVEIFWNDDPALPKLTIEFMDAPMAKEVLGDPPQSAA